MIAIKHGIAVYFPVKIRSIFSLRIRSLLSFGFTTACSHKRSMKSKRISAIAALRSTPRSVSIWHTICSNISFSFSSSFNCFRISRSPSIAFVAANRTGISAFSAWSSIRWITAWIHRCTEPSWSFLSQKSCRIGRSWYFAIWSACFTSSSTPSFLAAEIGMTGTPSNSSIKLTLIAPWLLVTSSIIFNATTIGISISKSCIVRYKLRSILVASTILIIAVGWSCSTKLRETISSLLYGDIE